MRRTRRVADAVVALALLVSFHLQFRLRGRRWVAAATRHGMAQAPAPQVELDARGIEAWHVGRAVWRAKRWLPFHTTCLQTALATQRLFRAKGVAAQLVVGVNSESPEAHAWVQVGDFVLDEQHLSADYLPFDAPAAAGRTQA